MFPFSFKLWYFKTSLTEKKQTPKNHNQTPKQHRGEKERIKEEGVEGEYHKVKVSVKATMKPLNSESVSLYTICKAA